MSVFLFVWIPINVATLEPSLSTQRGHLAASPLTSKTWVKALVSPSLTHKVEAVVSLLTTKVEVTVSLSPPRVEAIVFPKVVVVMPISAKDNDSTTWYQQIYLGAYQNKGLCCLNGCRQLEGAMGSQTWAIFLRKDHSKCKKITKLWFGRSTRILVAKSGFSEWRLVLLFAHFDNCEWRSKLVIAQMTLFMH